VLAVLALIFLIGVLTHGFLFPLGRVLPDVQRRGRSPAPLGGPSDRTNNRWVNPPRGR